MLGSVLIGLCEIIPVHLLEDQFSDVIQEFYLRLRRT